MVNIRMCRNRKSFYSQDENVYERILIDRMFQVAYWLFLINP